MWIKHKLHLTSLYHQLDLHYSKINPMKKKILKITGITLLSVIALLFAIPYMDNRLVIEDNLKQQVLTVLNPHILTLLSFL